MALGLLKGAHDAKGAEQVAIGVSGDARNDGVVGPLARPQAVWVLGIQQEVVAPVVQREATALWDDACTVSGSRISKGLANLSQTHILSGSRPRGASTACMFLMRHMRLQPASMAQVQVHTLSWKQWKLTQDGNSH